MTRRERLPLHEQASAKAPDEVPDEDHEGRPENIFVLLAGGIYGAILGVCFRGEFGMAPRSSSPASAWAGGRGGVR